MSASRRRRRRPRLAPTGPSTTPPPRDATRACAEATRAARTPAAYSPRATTATASTSQSVRHTSHHAVVPGSGGAGKPVSRSVGVGSGKSSGTGGALRERAVAMPKAAPMSATSPTARRRNGRPGSPASRSAIVERRCHHPAAPSATKSDDLGDDEQAVGRAEVGPGSEPRRRGQHPREPDRDEGPERQRRVAAGHDREPSERRCGAG